MKHNTRQYCTNDNCQYCTDDNCQKYHKYKYSSHKKYKVGPVGPIGPVGPVGPIGSDGPSGPAGLISLRFAYFYSVINESILLNGNVNFPNAGVNNSVIIIPGPTTNNGEFYILSIGVYEITFNIAVNSTTNGEISLKLILQEGAGSSNPAPQDIQPSPIESTNGVLSATFLINTKVNNSHFYIKNDTSPAKTFVQIRPGQLLIKLVG
jgi:hypothetical protein